MNVVPHSNDSFAVRQAIQHVGHGIAGHVDKRDRSRDSGLARRQLIDVFELGVGL